MTPRLVALLSAAIISLCGCGEQAATSPEQTESPTELTVAIAAETSDEDTISELEIACYDQNVAELADPEIKSLLMSDSETDSLSTDQTVRLAHFYQRVAQECFG